jgi:hypothetical protein
VCAFQRIDCFANGRKWHGIGDKLFLCLVGLCRSGLGRGAVD